MTDLQSWFAPMDGPREPSRSDEELTFKTLDESQIVDATEKANALLTRRIHLLGVGAIGILVAHSLNCLPNPPPMTLLMHREEQYDQFRAKSRIVRLSNKKTDVSDEQIGYDVDVLESQGSRADQDRYWRYVPHRNPAPREEGQKGGGLVERNPRNDAEILPSGETFIYTLIVTVKGPATVRALSAIKHRVDSRTTILFLQNGMGQIDALNKQVFVDPSTRPTYMIGVISHGAYIVSPFHIMHAGSGTIALGIHRDTDRHPLPPPDTPSDLSSLPPADRERYFPSESDLYSNLSSRYLLRTLTRSPILACAAYPYLDLFQLQLEKLVTNCVLNPLTALLDVPNGAMLDNRNLTPVQRLLITEISIVLRSLPELEGVPNAKIRFSPRRLESLFRGIAHKTALNSSSMREDVRMSRPTEIDYINGYIVTRGEQLQIRCALNYMILQLMKSKTYAMKQMGVPERRYNTPDIEATEGPDGSVILQDVGTGAGPARLA